MENVLETELSRTTFERKYKHLGCETWEDMARTLVEDMTKGVVQIPKDIREDMVEMIAKMKFIPGGRYLYYAGRPVKYFNNCYLLRAEEDSREDWANLSWKAESCLLTGGGIGIDYSRYRPSGSTIRRTGGKASGPIPKMFMVNEIGRNVMQGGSRRSALYASLNWKHDDADWFLKVKDWDNYPVAGTGKTYNDIRREDFNFPCPLDQTNISLNYDTDWLMQVMKGSIPKTFLTNVEMAMRNGEPGFSFNFFDKENETLRNACTEVTSEDDSDVCNLGSINLSRIVSLDELRTVVHLATLFLLLGTLKADLPYEKVLKVREKNRRLGLGLMGVHEWLIQRGYKYKTNPEFESWLAVYKGESDKSAKTWSNTLGLSTPVAVRSIAPTGTIGMLADTTTGIEPVIGVAYKRRYLVGSSKWKYQYSVEGAARRLIEKYDVDPESIESAQTLAEDFERRVAFQARVQDYVDMSISSTVNLPAFGTENNNPDKITEYAGIIAKYAHRLRGLTFYPDGARGGQPLVVVPYREAVDKLGKEFEEHVENTDICDLTGGGFCGS